MKIYKVVGLDRKLNVPRTEDGARRLARATNTINRESTVVSLHLLRDAPPDSPSFALAADRPSFRGLTCDAIAWLGRFQPFTN
jgi:hypothetical protein